MGLYCDLIRLSKGEIEKCLELKDEKAIYALIQQDRGSDWFDIDKAWHGIHFLLNKSNQPECFALGFLLAGGKSLNKYNWKEIYGVDLPDMRVFHSEEVMEISAAVSVITAKDFRKRYDPDLMVKNEVYPRDWESRKKLLNWVLAKYLSVSLHLNYLLFHFAKLKEFLMNAAQRELGIIIKYHQ